LGFYFFYGFSTQLPNIISKGSALPSTKVLSQEYSKFDDYNLAIYAVNFLKNVITYYLSGLEQDPIVGFPENKLEFNFL
jgi:hypothetical protein